MKNKIDIYLLTFNCARTLIEPDSFGRYLFDTLPEARSHTLPDVLVLSLEELAPIAYSFLGGSFLTPYYNAFRKAVTIAAGGATYINIVARNVGMTAILVFVKKDVAPAIAYIDTAGTGVGAQEMGNKGAVGVRLGLHTGDTEYGDDDVMETTFVAAHLAPMEDALHKRNDDWKSIVRGMVFTKAKTGEAGRRDEQSEETPLLQGLQANAPRIGSGLFSPQSHLFVAGDLNYRTSSSKPRPEDYNRYPSNHASPGDARHFSAFLPRDQLSKERLEGRTLHGLTEAPIHFPPTYKYETKGLKSVQKDDVGDWEWAEHRWPSWCDRVLYLDLPKWMRVESPESSIEIHGYNILPLFPTSDHRPVALSLTLPWRAIPEPPPDADDVRLSPPFDLDPDWNTRRSIARRKELVVGLLAYLGFTWEGNGLLAATVIGALGGYLILKSLLAA